MFVIVAGDPIVDGARTVRINTISRLASLIPGFDKSLPETTWFGVPPGVMREEHMRDAWNARHIKKNFIADVKSIKDVPPEMRRSVDFLVMTSADSVRECFEKYELPENLLSVALFPFTEGGSSQPLTTFDFHTRELSTCSN
jgi:hypothetical protein